MKRFLILPVSLFFMCRLYAQEPVEWSFFTKKLSGGSYEIHLLATIDKGWFICSQFSSKNGPSPTEIKISETGNAKLSGRFDEAGTMQKRKIANNNARLHVFENQVEFIQKATVPELQKAIVQGTINFVASDGIHTLPGKTVKFTLALN